MPKRREDRLCFGLSRQTSEHFVINQNLYIGGGGGGGGGNYILL